MNAQKIADKLVEKGIGHSVKHEDGSTRYIVPGTNHSVYAGTFISDWRVAGKVLEKCREAHLFWDDVDFGCTLNVGIGIPKGKGSVDGYYRLGLPRAICEAFAAQENEDGN